MARSKGKDTVKSALQRLMRASGDPSRITADLFGELEQQYDDRAAAIIFGSFVENALEAALKTHFVIGTNESAKLFSNPPNEGVLATFAAKITVGEALGRLRKKDEVRFVAC